MINWEMLTEEQQKIFRLELTIKKFKEYDAQRKQYVQNLEEQLNSLKEEVKNLKEELNTPKDVTISKLKNKTKNQLAHIRELNKKLEIVNNQEVFKILDNKDKYEIYRNNISLSKEIEHLRSINKVIREANSNLVCKLFSNEDALTILDIIDKLIIKKLQ